MLKVRSRLLGAAGAVVVAGAITVSGVAVAAAHTTHANASGIEQLQLMSTSATSSTAGVIARGVFTAAGVDHEGKKNTDTVVFPGGTFKITHSKGTGPQSFNPKTCLLTISQHGTYKLSGGTGSYAGISGSGKYQLSILAVAARSGGKCSKTKPPVAFQQIIKAAGPVKL
jgi:hypothetical protein